MSSPNLPGRAVDVVHAAAMACGRGVHSISARFSYEREIVKEIALNYSGTVSESDARAVFAALGVTNAVLGERYGSGPQANLEGDIPALGIKLSIIVDDLPSQPEAADPTGLIAQVDAARAAADADWTPEEIKQSPHGHPAHDGNPGNCAGCHAETFGAPAADEQDDDPDGGDRS